MQNTEIKGVKEYRWGSVVTVIEEDREMMMVTAKAGHLILTFALTNLLFLSLGFALGRI